MSIFAGRTHGGYGVLGLGDLGYGLGRIADRDPAMRDIQRALAGRLVSAGLPVIAADGKLGDQTYNALTWRLGPSWVDASSRALLISAAASGAPAMRDMASPAAVGQVQRKLNTPGAKDGRLGPGTWSAITASLGAGWWGRPFEQVRAAIVDGVPLPAPAAPPAPAPAPAPAPGPSSRPGWDKWRRGGKPEKPKKPTLPAPAKPSTTETVVVEKDVGPAEEVEPAEVVPAEEVEPAETVRPAEEVESKSKLGLVLGLAAIAAAALFLLSPKRRKNPRRRRR